MNTDNTESMLIELSAEYAGQRLDKALAQELSNYSRGTIQAWIKQGFVQIQGEVVLDLRYKVRGDESVNIAIPEMVTDIEIAAENISLDVLHEDSSIIVINKPAGLVVHPAVGNRSGTLQNALLFHYPELSVLPRSGIVHRLDKDTSGLLVVARNLSAHKNLVDQLQARTVHREYSAIIRGTVVAGGTINAPLGRHPTDRKRMAVVQGGREAITHYRVLERFEYYTALEVRLETGRTHQIRVHMAHIKKPLLGDPVYGGRLRLPTGTHGALKTALSVFKRQALHAQCLEFLHPETHQPQRWQIDLPVDMLEVLQLLRSDS